MSNRCIAVHSQYQDCVRGPCELILSNQRDAAKFPSPYAEVDEHHIKVVTTIEQVAGHKVAGLNHSSNPGVLRGALAPFENDRLINDYENRGHNQCVLDAARTTRIARSQL
jgi:hypothetical protein